jgi:hypothetical protein
MAAQVLGMKLIRVGAAKAVFGWPLFATWNAWIFASGHCGLITQARTFLTFVPVLVITTVMWAAFLTAIIQLVLELA